MAILNRILIVFLAMAFMVAGLVFLFEPQRSILATGDALRTFTSSPSVWPIASAVLVGLGALLLLLEFIPRRRQLLAQVESGIVEYQPATVARMLEHDLTEMDGVHNARVDVSGNERRVDVHASLAADPEHDPTDLVARAGNRIRERLEHGLGLGVGRVRMAIEPIDHERGWIGRRAA